MPSAYEIVQITQFDNNTTNADLKYYDSILGIQDFNTNIPLNNERVSIYHSLGRIQETSLKNDFYLVAFKEINPTESFIIPISDIVRYNKDVSTPFPTLDDRLYNEISNNEDYDNEGLYPYYYIKGYSEVITDSGSGLVVQSTAVNPSGEIVSLEFTSAVSGYNFEPKVTVLYGGDKIKRKATIIGNRIVDEIQQDAIISDGGDGYDSSYVSKMEYHIEENGGYTFPSFLSNSTFLNAMFPTATNRVIYPIDILNYTFNGKNFYLYSLLISYELSGVQKFRLLFRLKYMDETEFPLTPYIKENVTYGYVGFPIDGNIPLTQFCGIDIGYVDLDEFTSFDEIFEYDGNKRKKIKLDILYKSRDSSNLTDIIIRNGNHKVIVYKLNAIYATIDIGINTHDYIYFVPTSETIDLRYEGILVKDEVIESLALLNNKPRYISSLWRHEDFIIYTDKRMIVFNYGDKLPYMENISNTDNNISYEYYNSLFSIDYNYITYYNDYNYLYDYIHTSWMNLTETELLPYVNGNKSVDTVIDFADTNISRKRITPDYYKFLLTIENDTDTEDTPNYPKSYVELTFNNEINPTLKYPIDIIGNKIYNTIVDIMDMPVKIEAFVDSTERAYLRTLNVAIKEIKENSY